MRQIENREIRYKVLVIVVSECAAIRHTKQMSLICKKGDLNMNLRTIDGPP